MSLLRIYLACAILRAGAAAANFLMPEFPALDPVERREPAARPCPAGRILLASITGMAICAVWIAITWRAAG